jgi:ankyrin repeat protein
VSAILGSKDALVDVNFRDYDRRTPLHVAASEGHLNVCKVLIEEFGIRINRSDHWGGSPLDDAHRHRHRPVIEYLRGKGALTGSANKTTNLIAAAAQEGDYYLDEARVRAKSECAIVKGIILVGRSNAFKCLKNLDLRSADLCHSHPHSRQKQDEDLSSSYLAAYSSAYR